MSKSPNTENMILINGIAEAEGYIKHYDMNLKRTNLPEDPEKRAEQIRNYKEGLDRNKEIVRLLEQQLQENLAGKTPTGAAGGGKRRSKKRTKKRTKKHTKKRTKKHTNKRKKRKY